MMLDGWREEEPWEWEEEGRRELTAGEASFVRACIRRDWMPGWTGRADGVREKEASGAAIAEAEGDRRAWECWADLSAFRDRFSDVAEGDGKQAKARRFWTFWGWVVDEVLEDLQRAVRRELGRRDDGEPTAHSHAVGRHLGTLQAGWRWEELGKAGMEDGEEVAKVAGRLAAMVEGVELGTAWGGRDWRLGAEDWSAELEELGAWWGKRLARELERLEGAKAVAAAKKERRLADASDADLVKTFLELDEALKADPNPTKGEKVVLEGVLAEAATYQRHLGNMGPWQLKKAFDGWMVLGKPNAAQYGDIHRKLGRRPNRAEALRYVKGPRAKS